VERVRYALRLLLRIRMRHHDAHRAIAMPAYQEAMQICVASCTVNAPCSMSVNRESCCAAPASIGAALLRR
jgi:hypothetical protein